MASRHQIRGVLLEEAILKLLRASGYRTVTIPGSDPTLGTCSAGLTVSGRGTCHQIDAVADLRVSQPFSNPQRLLVEAKAYAIQRKVDLDVVKKTLGAWKDVSEFWTGKAWGNYPARNRYHYQSAIFSTSSFTSDAQRYAFAHDIYLLPLRKSSFFEPVIGALERSIDRLRATANGQVPGVDLTALRRRVRRALQPDLVEPLGPENTVTNWEAEFVAATQSVSECLVGTINQSFPLFLTPGDDVDLRRLDTNLTVRIRFADKARSRWVITDRDRDLFSFDLPEELFELYDDNGVLSRDDATNLKTEFFSHITAIYAPANEIRVFNLQLDPAWLDTIRARTRRTSQL